MKTPRGSRSSTILKAKYGEILACPRHLLNSSNHNISLKHVRGFEFIELRLGMKPNGKSPITSEDLSSRYFLIKSRT